MATAHAIPHAGVHEAHHETDFWRTYVFSTDHKIIGIQYAVTALFFLFFGFLLMVMMRWQIWHPGQPVPLVGSLLEKVLHNAQGASLAPKGIINGDLYNSFGAMH